MVFGGVFERHPKLTVLVSELGIDWFPGWSSEDGRAWRRPGSSPLVVGDYRCRSRRASTCDRNVRISPIPAPHESPLALDGAGARRRGVLVRLPALRGQPRPARVLLRRSSLRRRRRHARTVPRRRHRRRRMPAWATRSDRRRRTTDDRTRPRCRTSLATMVVQLRRGQLQRARRVCSPTTCTSRAAPTAARPTTRSSSAPTTAVVTRSWRGRPTTASTARIRFGTTAPTCTSSSTRGDEATFASYISVTQIVGGVSPLSTAIVNGRVRREDDCSASPSSRSCSTPWSPSCSTSGEPHHGAAAPSGSAGVVERRLAPRTGSTAVRDGVVTMPT